MYVPRLLLGLLPVACAVFLGGCAAESLDESEPDSTDGPTDDVSEASSEGCNIYIVTPDWQGSVCTAIQGKGLHTAYIEGTYGGNYICNYMDLYINGSRVESAQFCRATYAHTFKTGLNHNWPGKTSVKACVRNIPFKGQVCGPTLYIHA